MWLLVTGVLEVPGGVTAPVSMQTFKTHFVIFLKFAAKGLNCNRFQGSSAKIYIVGGR